MKIARITIKQYKSHRNLEQRFSIGLNIYEKNTLSSKHSIHPQNIMLWTDKLLLQ